MFKGVIYTMEKFEIRIDATACTSTVEGLIILQKSKSLRGKNVAVSRKEFIGLEMRSKMKK